MNIKKVVSRILTWFFILACVIAAAAAISAWLMIEKAKSRQQEDRVLSSPKGGEFVTADDTRMFVQRLGDKNAPAIVFIHGTGSWSETWRESMELSVKLGYQAFAIDLPPFGYSIPPASADYSKAKQAKRLLAVIDKLGIKQATFVAHSFGAAPVMEALMTDPARAGALVLVDAALGLDGPQSDGSDSGVRRILRQQWLAQSISAAFLTNPDFTRTLLQSFISEKDKATPEWIKLYQKPLSLSGSYQNIALWVPELLSRRGAAKSDDIAAYAKLQFPVTLVWGETDTITPMSQAAHLQRLIPGAKLIVIPRAGHIPQIEEPALFQASLSTALNRGRNP